MGSEVDLLVNYPKAQRDVKARGLEKTEADRAVARKFGRDFFDGSRKHGYGGFNYHPRFWQPVIPTMQEYWGLTSGSSVLDVGCAKGFMLYDMTQLIPGIFVRGVDISHYAIEHCIDAIRSTLQVADARSLPFEDNSFDVVISINTLHNLEKDDLAIALREIERVSRGKSYITVDAWRTEAERERMFSWNLTAKTMMHVDDWEKFFAKAGYTGDYFWFIP